MNTLPTSLRPPARVARLLTAAAGAICALVALAPAAAPARAPSHAPAATRVARPAGASRSRRHTPTTHRSTHKRPGVRLGVRHTRVGAVLTSPDGRTLYVFARDHGPRSSCYGGCAAIWPALSTSGRPRAGKGVEGRLLGTIKRREGRLQVTYHGHPLYTYAGDSAPGQANGAGIESFGGRWYAVSPGGARLAARGNAAP